MHPLAALLHQDNVVCHAEAKSRKRALQLIAELMSDSELDEDALFDGLMNRERLGSTALNDGVAIPHGRFDCARMKVALISLPEPIDYQAMDGQGVDLLFVLVVPADESQAHLDALAALARLFSSARNRAELRACDDDQSLLSAMQSQLNGLLDQPRSA